VGGSGGQLSGG
jgi:ATP-binding cassette subfamily B (MDR/TAP) protein 1